MVSLREPSISSTESHSFFSDSSTVFSASDEILPWCEPFLTWFAQLLCLGFTEKNVEKYVAVIVLRFYQILLPSFNLVFTIFIMFLYCWHNYRCPPFLPPLPTSTLPLPCSLAYLVVFFSSPPTLLPSFFFPFCLFFLTGTIILCCFRELSIDKQNFLRVPGREDHWDMNPGGQLE